MTNTQPTVSTWRYMLHLARYKLWLYMASAFLASIVSYLFPLLPGLIVRRILDQLSGAAPAALNTWTLLALLVGIAFTRLVVMLGISLTENSLHVVINTLLRHNLLARILEYPGARLARVARRSDHPLARGCRGDAQSAELDHGPDRAGIGHDLWTDDVGADQRVDHAGRFCAFAFNFCAGQPGRTAHPALSQGQPGGDWRSDRFVG